MGETERRNAEKELRDLQREVARLQTEFREDLNLRQNEELGKLQRSLLKEVQDYAQQEGFELIAPVSQVMHRIGACAAKVANGFIALIRHMHGGQFASTVKAREHACITTIRLDLVTRSFGRERWRNDIASDALLLQVTCQHETAGTRLITDA